MKSLFIHLSFFLLVVCLISLFLGIGIHPLLYSSEEVIGETPYHTNILAQKGPIINSSTDMLSVMQDILDYSGPIALNIRMKDLEAASRDLDEYYRKYKNLDKLVINLEMTESEIQDFTNNTRLQEDLYRELMNSSYSLDELKRLEFRYRDRNDAVGMTTVAYQGQALKRKIQTIRSKYQITSQNLINQSEQYSLDTTKIKQSQQDIDRYVQEVIADQSDKTVKGQPVQTTLSLILSPDQGIYRDKITYSGFITGKPGEQENVSIFLDNALYTSMVTDDIGQFRKTVEIEQVSAGIHTITARSGDLTSDMLNLTVFSVISTLHLDMEARPHLPEVQASGTLMTNRTVNNAPVKFVINNQTTNETSTNSKGEYLYNMSFPKGTHMVYAVFSDRSYPINSSKSQVYEIISSGTAIISIRLIESSGDSQETGDEGVVGILMVVIGSSVICIIVYTIWKRKLHSFTLYPDNLEKNEYDDHPNLTVSDDPIQKTDLEDTDDRDTSPISLFHQYQEVIRLKGLSEAARFVYLIFLDNISKEIPLQISRCLTPRELVGKIQKTSYGHYFSAFLVYYEKIRYGGSLSESDQSSFEEHMCQTDDVFHGGRDED